VDGARADEAASGGPTAVMSRSTGKAALVLFVCCVQFSLARKRKEALMDFLLN
jgi:preprotein translocase subunit SecG